MYLFFGESNFSRIIKNQAIPFIPLFVYEQSSFTVLQNFQSGYYVLSETYSVFPYNVTPLLKNIFTYRAFSRRFRSR